MTATESEPNPLPPGLAKVRTGISGLDEITEGGLPRGRPALVCGCAGSGKTLIGIEFLVRGALEYGEPGVLFSFEESAEELAANTVSLGFDLPDLIRRKLLVVQQIVIERGEIEETGEYNLDGLFVRLGHAVASIGARRVVLDTIEAIFSGFTNEAILRSELRRLFRWLKERGLTAVITAERGYRTLTRHGLEEYLTDCVILLDHRVDEQVSTRRLQIVKYRGSAHGTNEYPFLIDRNGIAVLPITSLGLDHPATTERISTGIPRLDSMLGGGVFRGSSVLVSGTAGTGKSSLAAHFAEAACRRGERCLYFAFEESPDQIIRNMRSIGIDLEPWVQRGLLCFYAVRPTLYGLEMHLATMHRQVEAFDPRVVILDPITNFINAGSSTQVKSMLMRLIDYLKGRQIVGFFTSLTGGDSALEATEVNVSSLIDTWLLVRFIETNGERNRGLYVLKSRGTAHSNQVREFLLTDSGVDLLDVYLGPSGVLTGTARYVQEARERAQAEIRRQELELRERELQRAREAMERELEAVRARFAAKEEELLRSIREEESRETVLLADQSEIARMRRADDGHPNGHH